MSLGKCYAVQESNEMRCFPCAKVWYVNDPNPPKCSAIINPTNTPAIRLRAAALLFEERNAAYKDNYKQQGAIIMAFFHGHIPEITTELEANRLHIFLTCLAKLGRYANNFSKGGHADSARDLQVYAAMLEEFTDDGA